MARSSIRDKINALRSKTRGNGCSEAEALAAAELAARLMADHGLSDEDLVMSEASATERTMAGWRGNLSATIAHCTNTAPIVLPSREGSDIMFVGRVPGPEIALYLRDICFRATEAELKRFKASVFYRRRRTLSTRRAAAADFVEGFVARLNARLLELFRPMFDVAARDEAHKALKRRFSDSVAIRKRDRKLRFSEAATKGFVAGGNVALNHGVSTPDVARLGHG